MVWSLPCAAKCDKMRARFGGNWIGEPVIVARQHQVPSGFFPMIYMTSLPRISAVGIDRHGSRNPYTPVRRRLIGTLPEPIVTSLVDQLGIDGQRSRSPQIALRIDIKTSDASMTKPSSRPRLYPPCHCHLHPAILLVPLVFTQPKGDCRLSIHP